MKMQVKFAVSSLRPEEKAPKKRKKGGAVLNAPWL